LRVGCARALSYSQQPRAAAQTRTKGKKGKKEAAPELTPEQMQEQANKIRSQIIDWHNTEAGPRTPSHAFQVYLDRAAKGEPAAFDAPPPPKDDKKKKKKKK